MGFTPYLRDYDAFNSDSAKMQEFSLHFGNFAGDSNAIPCSTHLLEGNNVSESDEFWMIWKVKAAFAAWFDTGATAPHGKA